MEAMWAKRDLKASFCYIVKAFSTHRNDSKNKIHLDDKKKTPRISIKQIAHFTVYTNLRFNFPGSALLGAKCFAAHRSLSLCYCCHCNTFVLTTVVSLNNKLCPLTDKNEQP